MRVNREQANQINEVLGIEFVKEGQDFNLFPGRRNTICARDESGSCRGGQQNKVIRKDQLPALQEIFDRMIKEKIEKNRSTYMFDSDLIDPPLSANDF